MTRISDTKPMSDSPNNYNADSTAPRLLPPGRQEGPERAQNSRAATHRRMPRSLHRRWMGIVPGQYSSDLPYAPAWDVRGERTSIPRRTPTDWQRALGVLSNQWRTIIIFAVIVSAGAAAATFAMRPVYEPEGKLQIDPPGSEVFSRCEDYGDYRGKQSDSTDPDSGLQLPGAGAPGPRVRVFQ